MRRVYQRIVMCVDSRESARLGVGDDSKHFKGTDMRRRGFCDFSSAGCTRYTWGRTQIMIHTHNIIFQIIIIYNVSRKFRVPGDVMNGVISSDGGKTY